MVLKKLSRPLELGRSHWYVIGTGEGGGSERMEDRTLSEAAIWGTHFGATKEPASMVVRPVRASLLTKSIFVSAGMLLFSFWSPSLGPTSMILTWSARGRGDMENDRRESCWNPRRPNTVLDIEDDIVGV